MTSEELKDLINKTIELQAESQDMEIKKAKDGCPERLYDTLSSFSNQNEGGILLFGIDEKNGFEKTGVYDSHDLQTRVTDQCKQMSPVVRPLFTLYEEDGKSFVSAEIPPIDLAERPCFYKGKGRVKGSYKRVGVADEPMTEYEVYSYEAFREKYQDDVRPLSQCEPSSLDQSALADYMRKLKQGKPNLEMLDDEEIYHLMSIKKDSSVTLFSELMFGIYPQSCVPQLCIIAIVVPGIQIGDTGDDDERFIDNKRIEGTIPQMLEAAIAFVRKNMNTKTVIDPQTGERSDIPDYPLIAIREIILNALIHRDYSIHTEGMPIQINMYVDRIEIRSPGGLYGRIQIDQLGNMQPDTRNPAIATAMEVLGLTENRYSGIPTIRREMKKAHLLGPKFEELRDNFVVTLFKGKAAKVIDSDKSNSIKREALLSFLETPRSRDEIAGYLGLTSVSYAMRKHINPLIESGAVAMLFPDRPKSSKQRYYSTEVG